MGLLRRLSYIIRGYVASAEDKIDKVAAEEELRLVTRRQPLGDTLSHTDFSPHAQVRRHIGRLEADYKMLGVSPGSDLAAVEDAWRKLASRADPKRFPAGSEEEKSAAKILDSINLAYKRIREELNPTEGRFGRLEL